MSRFSYRFCRVVVARYVIHFQRFHNHSGTESETTDVGEAVDN